MATIVTSRVPLIIDTLITLLNASAVFADPVRVLDGPSSGDRTWYSAVAIGWDGDDGGNFETALVTHDMPYELGNTSAVEEFDLRCAAMAWGGEPNAKVHRDAAYGLLAGVETIIRTDPTLGIDGATVANIRTATTYQAPVAQGWECRVVFDVRVRTWLSTS